MGNYTKVSGVATGDLVKFDGVANASIVKINGATRTGAVAATYEWVNTEIFDHNTVATGSTSSPDDGNGSWDAYGGYKRMPLSTGGEYSNTVIPFLDVSSSTPSLKIADTHHMHDAADDWWAGGSARMTGSQVVAGNHGLCMKSLTGVEFDGENMVEGDHGVMMISRHDLSKTDNWVYSTAILSCVNNDTGSQLTAYRHTISYNNGNANPYSFVIVKADQYIQWQLEWHSATNTWTIVRDDDDFFDGSANAAITYQTTGSFVGKHIGDTKIRGPGGSGFADPVDHWVWKIEVEET